MKIVSIIPVILVCIACMPSINKDELKNEIYQTEKAFEKMAKEKGSAEAFYFFADENAVIKRGNDSLITGKENIKNFYEKRRSGSGSLSWTPDFIDVSASGDLGYTFGQYTSVSINEKGDTIENHGVFHTVWKREGDKSWKYVWD